jgi:hypothetical protein
MPKGYLWLLLAISTACNDPTHRQRATVDAAPPRDAAIARDAAMTGDATYAGDGASSTTDAAMSDIPHAALDASDGEHAHDAALDDDAKVRQDATPPPPDLAHAQFYGRWDLTHDDRAITVNGGSHVTARFEGGELRALFDVSANQDPIPTLAWQIDGGAWREGLVSDDVLLDSGLAPGAHSVLLMARGLDEHQSRWTSPRIASLTFLGFVATDGNMLSSTRPVRTKIEFLGDSITEGVLQQPVSMGRTTWPWQTDALTAYPAATALQLGAEWRQIGFGGQGLTRGGSGGVPAAPDAFNYVYDGVPRDAWIADIVVVNQGTNDGAADITTALKTYLDEVRAAYLSANILVLRPFSGAQATTLSLEVQRRNKAGDAKVFFIDTTGWLGSSDFSDGLHPNTAGSAKITARLVTELAPYL